MRNSVGTIPLRRNRRRGKTNVRLTLTGKGITKAKAKALEDGVRAVVKDLGLLMLTSVEVRKVSNVKSRKRS